MRYNLSYAALGTYYNALEENRADLCAIYHATDPKLLEIGVIDSGISIADLQYYMLLSKITNGAFLALRTTASDQINQAHQQGHVMTLNWLRFGSLPLMTWGGKHTQTTKTND